MGGTGKKEKMSSYRIDPSTLADKLAELLVQEMEMGRDEEDIDISEERSGDIEGVLLDQALMGPDLRTLLGEMAALKREVRTYTEESRQAQGQAERVGFSNEDGPKLHEILEEIQKSKADSGKRAASALIDIADRIAPALRAADVLAVSIEKGEPLSSRAMRSLATGLRMTIERLEAHLAQLGIKPLQAKGRAFEPASMEVVGTVQRPDLPEGRVVEEVTRGYIDSDGSTMARTAQVVVNKLNGAPVLPVEEPFAAGFDYELASGNASDPAIQLPGPRQKLVEMIKSLFEWCRGAVLAPLPLGLLGRIRRTPPSKKP